MVQKIERKRRIHSSDQIIEHGDHPQRSNLDNLFQDDRMMKNHQQKRKQLTVGKEFLLKKL